MEWTGLEFAKFQEGSGEQRKMEDTGYDIIRGAPVTTMIKGQVKVQKVFNTPGHLDGITLIIAQTHTFYC